MKIGTVRFYNGACEKISELGLADALFALLQSLNSTVVLLKEEKDAGNVKAMKDGIDRALEAAERWTYLGPHAVGWVSIKTWGDDAKIAMAAEVQVPAKSDLGMRRLLHMRDNMNAGGIETVAVVVPSDRASKHMPNSPPPLCEMLDRAEKEFEEMHRFPLVLIAVEHDTPFGMGLGGAFKGIQSAIALQTFRRIDMTGPTEANANSLQRTGLGPGWARQKSAAENEIIANKVLHSKQANWW